MLFLIGARSRDSAFNDQIQLSVKILRIFTYAASAGDEIVDPEHLIEEEKYGKVKYPDDPADSNNLYEFDDRPSDRDRRRMCRRKSTIESTPRLLVPSERSRNR